MGFATIRDPLKVTLDETKKPQNQVIKRLFKYPDPGSNRDGKIHWCLRPARLPIPPSGRMEIQIYRFFYEEQEVAEKR